MGRSWETWRGLIDGLAILTRGDDGKAESEEDKEFVARVVEESGGKESSMLDMEGEEVTGGSTVDTEKE